jgi:outer membrane protein
VATAWLFLVLASGALAQPEVPASADLARCYAWAQAQSESLRIQGEGIYQLRQQYRQVLGTLLPDLGYAYSVKFLDASGASLQGTQPQANFTLTQTLFSGFKELAAMASFRHQEKAGELRLSHARTALFQDAAGAFYLIVDLETQLANVRSAVDLSETRLKELRSWVELGKSRHSEVVLVESQKASYEARAESIRGQIDSARTLLSFLTGRDMRRTRLEDGIERVRCLEPEESLLAKALDRSDVRALLEEASALRESVRVAESAWYPSAGFAGNYYNYRTGDLRPARWDAFVGVSLPLFQGGASSAALRQASSGLQAATLASELSLRRARSQIQSAYATLRASIAESDASERSFQKAEECYRLQQKEYRLGLVSNLDVLAAMNSLLNARLLFDQAVIEGKMALLNLRAAVEDVP